MDQVKFGMIGGGTVGSGVFHALCKNSKLLASRLGVNIAIQRVAVKAFDEPRPYEIPPSVMTTNWEEEVVKDPEIQVVAELVGGTTIAKTIVLEALKLGKPVVTANKALLSKHGEELFEAARKHDTNLYYEASVCGGTVIKSLREGFVGNRINRLYGIVNGTCNYILTRMNREGAEFQTVLKDAQKLGYAEAEPSLDVDGFDAQHQGRHPRIARARLLG